MEEIETLKDSIEKDGENDKFYTPREVRPSASSTSEHSSSSYESVSEDVLNREPDESEQFVQAWSLNEQRPSDQQEDDEESGFPLDTGVLHRALQTSYMNNSECEDGASVTRIKNKPRSPQRRYVYTKKNKRSYYSVNDEKATPIRSTENNLENGMANEEPAALLLSYSAGLEFENTTPQDLLLNFLQKKELPIEDLPSVFEPGSDQQKTTPCPVEHTCTHSNDQKSGEVLDENNNEWWLGYPRGNSTERSGKRLFDRSPVPTIIVTSSEIPDDTFSYDAVQRIASNTQIPKIIITPCSSSGEETGTYTQGEYDPLTGLLTQKDSRSSIEGTTQSACKKDSVNSIETVPLSVSQSLETELAAAAKPFQNIDRPSIKVEIEEALRHESKHGRRKKVEIAPDDLNDNLMAGEKQMNSPKSILKQSPTPKRPNFSALQNFVKISAPENQQNLSGLTDKKVSIMFKFLGSCRRKRVHWVSYQPQLRLTTTERNPKDYDAIKLQLNPRDYVNSSFVDPNTGLTYTVFEQVQDSPDEKEDEERESPNEEEGNSERRNKKHNPGRDKSKTALRLEVLGWHDGKNYRFIHLERRRPAFLFVTSAIPRDVDTVHLILSRFVDDAQSFRTRCVHSGGDTLHFALVNQSLRFSGEPIWQYSSDQSGLLNEYTSKCSVIQFKEEHKCLLKRYRAAKCEKSKQATSSSSSESKTGSSCSDSCVLDKRRLNCNLTQIKGRNDVGGSTDNTPNAGATSYSPNGFGDERMVHSPKPGVFTKTDESVNERMGIGITSVRKTRPSLKLAIARYRGTSTPLDDYEFELASDYTKLLNEELDQLEAENQDDIFSVTSTNFRPGNPHDCGIDFGKSVVFGFIVTGIVIILGRKIYSAVKS